MTDRDKDDALSYEEFLRRRRETLRKAYDRWRDALISKDAYTADAATSIMLAEWDLISNA